MESQALDSMTLVRLTPSLESAAVHIIIIIFLPAFENKYLLTSLCSAASVLAVFSCVGCCAVLCAVKYVWNLLTAAAGELLCCVVRQQQRLEMAAERDTQQAPESREQRSSELSST